MIQTSLLYSFLVWFLYLPRNVVRGVYWNQVVRLSVCHTFVRKIISSEPLNHNATKLGTMVHHHNLECYANRLHSYLQGQGHSVGSNSPKITDSSISPEFLNVCNQIWYKGASAHAGVLRDNFWLLLSSRSRSQWGSKSSLRQISVGNKWFWQSQPLWRKGSHYSSTSSKTDLFLLMLFM